MSEAEQIVDAVRERGLTSWYVLAPDEAHGFRKRASRDVFFTTMAVFFERKVRSDPPE